MKVLVSGSEGLIGSALSRALRSNGVQVVPFDLRRSRLEDVCHFAALSEAAEGVDGIVHLAAVSRIVWGERDPERCRAVNVGAVRNVLRLSTRRGVSPWCIVASSREVYGQQNVLPVREDVALMPMNVYARSKAAGEALVAEAVAAGAVANVVRFSNVFGDTDDHPDRVVPAFARAAALGGAIRVEGSQNLFDFTCLDDVVQGLIRLIELTARGRTVAPIHLVSGVGTTLGELAELARSHARAPVTVSEAPARTFDVARFCGATERAAEILGWRAETGLEQGFASLIEAIARKEARASVG